MNINIREHIMNNFKGLSSADIRESITASVNDDEITLPGLGVFFELLWSNSSEEHKKQIISILKNSLK